MPRSGAVSTAHRCSVFCVWHQSWNCVPAAQGFAKFSDATHRALSKRAHSRDRGSPTWLEPRVGVFCSDHEGHPGSHSLDIPEGLGCHQLPGKAGTAEAWPGWQLECNWVSLCSCEASSDPSSGAVTFPTCSLQVLFCTRVSLWDTDRTLSVIWPGCSASLICLNAALSSQPSAAWTPSPWPVLGTLTMAASTEQSGKPGLSIIPAVR